MSYFYTYSSFLALIASIIISGVVLLKSSDKAKAVSFSYIAMMAGIWSSVPFFASVIPWVDARLLVVRMIYIAAIFTGPAFVNFGLVVSNDSSSKSSRLFIIASHILSAAFLPLLFSNKLISNVEINLPYARVVPGPIFFVFVATFFLLCSYSFLRIFLSFLKSRGSARNVLWYIFIAYLFAFFSALIHFSVAYGMPEVFPHDLLVIACMLLLAYTVIRFHVMDIRVAVTKAGLFLMVYAAALGVPFYLHGIGYQTWALWLAVIFATVAPLIYSLLRKRAEDEILKEEKNYQEILITAAPTLINKTTVNEIINSLMEIFSRTIQVKCAAFYLFDGQKYVLKSSLGEPKLFAETIKSDLPLITFCQSFGAFFLDELHHMAKHSNCGICANCSWQNGHPIYVAVPIKQIDKTIGVIFLGEKTNEKIYSEYDLSVFKVVASQVSLAITNAVHLERKEKGFMEEMQDRRLKDMGIMSANVCHQMCNRLNHVNWISAGLEMEIAGLDGIPEESKKECKKLLDELNQHVDNAVKMADALKTYSNSGKDKKNVTLERVVSIARVIADGKHKGYEYGFVTKIEEGLKVFCNETSLQDVFMNAIDNGIDSMNLWKSHAQCPADYKPRIEVHAHGNGEFAIVDVIDNGQGFLVSDMNRAFTPYFTTKGLDKGTGLGLHAMREIVRQNGGTVDIISEAFKGATIRIKLPLPTNNTTTGEQKA